MTLSEAEKQEILRQARERLCDAFGWPEVLPGSCLHASHYLMLELHKRGIEARIQAGSLSWPILPDEEDDGESPTHFTYQWSPQDVASLVATVAGGLPEMHVWVGVLDPPAILDLSTGALRRHCEELGQVWRTPEPPESVWSAGPCEEFGAIYKPEPAAIRMALSILWHRYQPAYMPSSKIRFTGEIECSK